MATKKPASFKTVPAQKTVLETILEWSMDRPLWQRDSLRRIVAKGKIDTTDIKELIELCKQGKGKRSLLKAKPFEKEHLPANPSQGEAVLLISVSDIDGVNNLAPGQTLDFEPNGLTVIYGDNGSGKSGYVRILKRACRARHAGKIEPNVYEMQRTGPATAKLTYGIGGVPQPQESWEDSDHPHATLSAISVFDSECASIQINDKNEVAFRPFGLDIPDELANLFQIVREALTAEQNLLKKNQNPIFVKPQWKENTSVGKGLKALKHDSDLETLVVLATLTDEETARFTRLKEDLSKNPAKAVAEQTLKADNLKRLLHYLNDLADKTADYALSAIFTLDHAAKLKRETARLAAAKAFSGDALNGVGGEVWRSLWEAARRYSMEVAYVGQPFPPKDAEMFCLLCQQPLDKAALERMGRFEEFIQKDTEKQAQAAEAAFKSALKEVSSVNIGTRAQKANLQELALQNPTLARLTGRFIASARLRRFSLWKSLEGQKDLALPPWELSPTTEITQLESIIREYIAELQKSATADERKKLETDLAELTDRSLLKEIIATIREEHERLQGIHFLDQCIADTNTTAITKIGNDIADTVITPRLRDRFQEEIIKLAAEKVRVEIVRSGGKYGSPQYQVRLFANPNAKVGDVLSEGEQTCVALASFLTELATAMHRSTLVFDDPVSSLDHRWRQKVAKRLVEEAEHRQIVVFTHDLIFVTDLEDLAAQQRKPVRLITVARGQAGAGMISEGLPWKGKGVEDRVDKLGKAARAAKTLYDDNKEDEYNDEAADIYSNLRNSWERALEEIVFHRVVLRHRDYIDTKNLRKVTVLDDADCDTFEANFKKCCDITDAHDKSSGRNATPPPPNELLQDIDILRVWVLSLRDRQKRVV